MRTQRHRDRPAERRSRDWTARAVIASTRSTSAASADDLARSVTCGVDVEDEASGARGVREGDALADTRGKRRRIVISEAVGGLAGDHGARGAAVEHKTRDELRAEDARFLQQLQHLGRAPAVEGRRLRGDQDEIGGEQGRAQQAGDARRPVDDDVVGVAGELRRFPVQRVARQADDAEQARHGLLGALRGPVESRALRIGVDDRDALSLRPPMRRPSAGRASSCRRRLSG